MPVKIDKQFYKKTLEQYNKLSSEINNGNSEISSKISIIQEKYNQIKESGGIDRKKPENYPGLVSLYLLAKNQQTSLSDSTFNNFISEMEDDLTLELPFFPPQLESLKKSILTENPVKVDDFKEILGTGKIVLDNEETRKKEAEKEEQKKKEAEQKQKDEEKRAKEKREREAKKKEEAQKEKEAGDKFWEEMEKNNNIPKYDPDKKIEPKKEEAKQKYDKDSVSSEAIESFLNAALNIYNGFSNRSTKIGNKTEFPKQLSDDEIGEKLKNNSNPQFTVDNLIDRVAMYKAQKAKFNSLNPFKRFFSFMFSDARKLKNNMNAIENSFSNQGIKAADFRTIANKERPALMIKNGVNDGVIGINNDGSKKLFENSSIDSKSVYMEQHPELIERNQDIIDSLKENEANIEKKIKVQIAKDLDKELIEIDDEALEADSLDKAFYGDESHERSLKDAGKYNELKELEDQEELEV